MSAERDAAAAALIACRHVKEPQFSRALDMARDLAIARDISWAHAARDIGALIEGAVRHPSKETP